MSLYFFQLPEVVIVNSKIYSNTGSHTIVVYKSQIIFKGQVVFENNTSTIDGGALHLDGSSLLYFKSNTSIAFIKNKALKRGGAIYVENTKADEYLQHIFCFFELEDMAKYHQANVQLVFEGNLAGIAGDALYGGQINKCTLFPSTSLAQRNLIMDIDFKEKNLYALVLDPADVFESLFNFTDKTPSRSLISSDPFRICFCSNESEPDFAVEQSIHTEAYPGQTFHVESCGSWSVQWNNTGCSPC